MRCLAFILTILDFLIDAIFSGYSGQYILVVALFDFIFASQDSIDMIQLILLENWYC